MTVPALDTSKITIFAWWREDGCYNVELNDLLAETDYYDQYSEYFDMVYINGNPWGPINVRVRSDGYIMAWFSEWSNSDMTASTITDSASAYSVVTPAAMDVRYYSFAGGDLLMTLNEFAGATLEFTSGVRSGESYYIISNTATTFTLANRYEASSYHNLHDAQGDTFKIVSSTEHIAYDGEVNPTSKTSLSNCMTTVWNLLKANSKGGAGGSLDYTQVNYYSYEFPLATSFHMIQGTEYYMLTPTGFTIYDIIAVVERYSTTSAYIYVNDAFVLQTYTYARSVDISSLLRASGLRNKIKTSAHYSALGHLLILSND